MTLSAGTRLGVHEVVAPIGAGGMGEVYRAKDTKLDREVAIKVLPEHIAQREDLRARFEREARAVASLNHPNMCTLHDIGPNYMVLELIEGETLAARIEKGSLPLDQALSHATQIADALDRAHRAGVTHRDGQGFLVLEGESAAQERRPMVVIQNWAARLTEGR